MMRLTLLVCLLLVVMPAVAVAQKKGKQPPEPGTVFHVSDRQPGWATCDVEFRDPEERLWPNFFYGRPAGAGTFTFDPRKPTASLTLRCEQLAQKNGDQSRRVLGELLRDGRTPVVTLTVRAMGALVTERRATLVNGKKKTTTVEFAPVEAVLAVDGRQVPVRAVATFRWSYARNAERPEAVYLDLLFTVNPADLGLSKPSGALPCRAGVTAYVTLPDAKKGRR